MQQQLQIEIRESLYNFKVTLETMDCAPAQASYMDLKLEDNGDYCLINSYFGFEKQDAEEGFMDELLEDPPVAIPNLSSKPNSLQFVDQIISEAASYICFRTTSLHGIMDYLQNYYRLPQDKRKNVLSKARRLKLQLKRAHAKQRSTVEVVSALNCLPSIIDIKVEESQLSPFVFDGESQETRKKKRNRMSAQNSRDRKKEYIRQIQNQNRQLKKKLAQVQQKQKMPSSSKDFIKLVLCLGIACYANIHLSSSSMQVAQKKSLFYYQEESFIDKLPEQSKLLNSWQQKALSELMETLNETKECRETMHYQCSELIQQAISEKSTSSEGHRMPKKSQFC